MREERWKWWRDQGSHRKRSLHLRMRWDKHADILSHAMCARNECDNARLRRLTTTRTFTCSPSVSRHCRVSCALCWSWFSRCHWCRTSHRSAGRFYTSTWFHHADAIANTKFFSSGRSSLALSCHRQLKLYPKFLHISHRENGSFDVLSLQRWRLERDQERQSAVGRWHWHETDGGRQFGYRHHDRIGFEVRRTISTVGMKSLVHCPFRGRARDCQRVRMRSAVGIGMLSMLFWWCQMCRCYSHCSSAVCGKQHNTSTAVSAKARAVARTSAECGSVPRSAETQRRPRGDGRADSQTCWHCGRTNVDGTISVDSEPAHKVSVWSREWSSTLGVLQKEHERIPARCEFEILSTSSQKKRSLRLMSDLEKLGENFYIMHIIKCRWYKQLSHTIITRADGVWFTMTLRLVTNEEEFWPNNSQCWSHFAALWHHLSC